MSNKKGFKFVQKEVTRERLQKAVPFVNAEGHPVTASDLFGMYVGERKINSLYLQAEELTTDFIEEYFKLTTKAFEEAARENVMSKKEAWKAMCDTEAMQAVKEKEIVELGLDVVRGEAIPTIDQCKYVMSTYKDCPLCIALLCLVDHPLPELEQLHEKMKTLASG